MIWVFLGLLAGAALLVDRIPPRRADWGSAAATQRDVYKIAKGQKREEPRHGLKLAIILILAWALFVALQ